MGEILNALGPIELDPEDEDWARGRMVGDEPIERIKVDEPTAVGADDMVSRAVELFTAAEPIGGPIEVESALELDPMEVTVLLTLACPIPLRNACVDGGCEMTAGYGFPERSDGVEIPIPVEEPNGDVVPWTELRETPAVVGAKPLASGFNNAASALAGSIWTLRLVSAAGSTRLVSIGGCTNVAGGSELD